MTNVLRERFVMKRLLLCRLHRAQSQDLPQQAVVIGQMLQPVIVAIQPQSHHAQNQDLPQVQPGTPSGLLACDELAFKQNENPGVDLGGLKNPLHAGENGWQFIATLQGQDNLLDGSFPKRQLDLESFPHGPAQYATWRPLTSESQPTKSPFQANPLPLSADSMRPPAKTPRMCPSNIVFSQSLYTPWQSCFSPPEPVFGERTAAVSETSRRRLLLSCKI